VGKSTGSVVVVLGGISASKHVATSASDPSTGWWDALVGPGRAIDTDRVLVLGIDWLDGGCAVDGRPERIVTTHDQARGLAATLDHLGIDRVGAVVGSSYGGMVGLAFAELWPERVDRLVVISAPAEAHPMSTALRSIQRQIVELALESGRAADGLALARMLAMTTYRSRREFRDRFASGPIDTTDRGATFPVEEYLRHCGARFASAWAPHRYLALSLSSDLHRVDSAAIRVPAVLVAAEGDTIVPGDQMQELSIRLGARNDLVTLPTLFGHDAFLTEPAKVGQILQSALATTTFRSIR
jgi:homoserine O-acetyltransferase